MPPLTTVDRDELDQVNCAKLRLWVDRWKIIIFGKILVEIVVEILWRKSFGGKSDGISIISFDSNDIQRSKIVNKIIEIYEDRRPSLPIPKSSTLKKEKEEIISEKLKKKIKDELDKQFIEMQKKSKENETKDEDNKNQDAAMIPLKDIKRINKRKN